PVGVAGPVVVPLFVAPTPPTSARHITQSGVATPNAGTTGAALCANPSAYYVNYHTTAFPGGAIRRQLHQQREGDKGRARARPFFPSKPSWLGGGGDRDAASRFLPQRHLHHVRRKLEPLRACP